MGEQDEVGDEKEAHNEMVKTPVSPASSLSIPCHPPASLDHGCLTLQTHTHARGESRSGFHVHFVVFVPARDRFRRRGPPECVQRTTSMRSLVRPVLVPVRAALPSLRRGRRSFWFNSDQSDYKRRLAQRINWDKPGERLKYIADDVLYAMPPPGRPMPLSAAELRRQELRSKLPLLVLVLFAAGHIAYSRVNETRDSRVFLEERFPSLARALAFVGFLKRFPESVRRPRDRSFVIASRRGARPA